MLSKEEVLERLRRARANQLEALGTLERRLQETDQELLDLQNARDMAAANVQVLALQRRGTKRAAGVLAAASITATITLSVAFGPLGLLGLLGLGAGASVAGSIDAAERALEREVAEENRRRTSEIRALEELKGRIARKRGIVEEKLRRTRSLLDKLI